MDIGGKSPNRALEALSLVESRAPDITSQERQERVARAQSSLVELGLDALFVNVGASLRYFTGVTWSPTERLVGMLLPAKGQPIMICPVFELGSLMAEMQIDADYRLWQEEQNPAALVADALPAGAVLAVDPLLAFGAAHALAKYLRIESGAQIIDGLRMVKSPTELALLQDAKSLTLQVHELAASILCPGIRASEVKRFIDQAHRALGGSGSTFCAVQFGHATAYPHGLPDDQILEENQLVLIDTGTTWCGYHSDITRTYAFGKVSQEIEDLWEVEKLAQTAAFDAARPGELCETVDYAARKVLEKAGLGPDYNLPGLPHRTGHGIGLSIHEPCYLVRGDKTPLQPGMCFSNEPMIVVPERFGIRLEDHMFITENGAQWFTQPQNSLYKPFS